MQSQVRTKPAHKTTTPSNRLRTNSNPPSGVKVSIRVRARDTTVVKNKETELRVVVTKSSEDWEVFDCMLFESH